MRGTNSLGLAVACGGRLMGVRARQRERILLAQWCAAFVVALSRSSARPA